MTHSARAPILGIDLGTTYSLCAVLQDGKPLVIPNALSEVLTASAVSVDDDGTVLVGALARARAATHPAQTATTFKRDMGTDRSVKLGRKTFRPEELSALVLAELKRDAEQALGMPLEEAVITVPAYFGDSQRQATRVAGELAGFRVDRIINEPTAAALAYGLHARDRDLRAVVLDLGGGTFDVTVIEIVSGVIEVQASAGDARLGGEDFTDALATELERELRALHGVDVAAHPVSRARVREAAETAKKAVSTADETIVALPRLEGAGNVRRDVQLRLDRARCEAAWQPLLERIRQPIARALRDCDAKPSQLDEVLLVGGATRMPCLVELVAKTFSRMPNRHLPPDEAVVMGAAVQAALKQGDAAVDDLVVTDIAPFTLGIASVIHHGERVVTGIFSPIIERGTVIPVSRSELFSTVQHNQSVLRVEVYQGEHSLCRDNVKLGEYEMKGLPRRPAGETQIEVRFTYDMNGILEVESSVVGSHEKQALVIQQRPGVLSRAQLAAAREAMKKLKFHPREALPNQTALARADALYVELTGPDREALGRAISLLRGALDTQNRAQFEPAREHLVQLTEALRRGAR